MPAVGAVGVVIIHRQFLMQVCGKYGGTDVETVGKAVYQLFDVIIEKQFQIFHTG
jgi:hypothetical protein